MPEVKWDELPDKPKDERLMCFAAGMTSGDPPRGCKVYIDTPYPHWVTLTKGGEKRRWPSPRCQPCAQAALDAGKWWMIDRWWELAEPVK